MAKLFLNGGRQRETKKGGERERERERDAEKNYKPLVSSGKKAATANYKMLLGNNYFSLTLLAKARLASIMTPE